MTTQEQAFFNGFFKQAAYRGVPQEAAAQLYYKYAQDGATISAGTLRTPPPAQVSGGTQQLHPGAVGAPGSIDIKATSAIGNALDSVKNFATQAASKAKNLIGDQLTDPLTQHVNDPNFNAKVKANYHNPAPSPGGSAQQYTGIRQ
jgi:hypothetical protein